jgi:hypothetical protein
MKEKFICAYCEQSMTAEQIICCDTYKGKMTVADFVQVYGLTSTY